MDSAIFIRKPGVLAAWILAPLATVVLIHETSRQFVEWNQIRLLRNTALEREIPAMQLGLQRFQRFFKDHALNGTSSLPAEDAWIAAMNSAAESSAFTISSIKLTVEPIENSEAGTLRIHVEGSGPAPSVAGFLINLRSIDRFLCEDRLLISRALDENNRSICKLEADLYKVIYPGPEGDSL